MYSSLVFLLHNWFSIANAQLRIVSERVEIIDNVIISVSIGPPNSNILKSKDKCTWNPKDVVDSVLSDMCALRVTSTQPLAESSILDAHSSEIDGDTYWVYEYFVRKSLSVWSSMAHMACVLWGKVEISKNGRGGPGGSYDSDISVTLIYM